MPRPAQVHGFKRWLNTWSDREGPKDPAFQTRKHSTMDKLHRENVYYKEGNLLGAGRGTPETWNGDHNNCNGIFCTLPSTDMFTIIEFASTTVSAMSTGQTTADLLHINNFVWSGDLLKIENLCLNHFSKILVFPHSVLLQTQIFHPLICTLVDSALRCEMNAPEMECSVMMHWNRRLRPFISFLGCGEGSTVTHFVSDPTLFVFERRFMN